MKTNATRNAVCSAAVFAIAVSTLTVAADQKSAPVAFPKTLTDPNLATDPKLFDTFNYGD